MILIFEMTKKFWNDWKRRLGETEEIYLFYDVYGERRWHGISLSGHIFEYCDHFPFKILEANFNGNTSVDLKLEITKPSGFHYTTENRYITLLRKDIATIKFKKNETKSSKQ